MKHLFILLIIIIVSAAHPFHVAITEVDYKENTLQITHRLFIDDFEDGLKETFQKSFDLFGKTSDDSLRLYLNKYIKSNFTISNKNMALETKLIGFEKEEEVIYIYIESLNEKYKFLNIKNTILCKSFTDQSNIVHLKHDGEIQSLLLNNETTSGSFKVK